MAITQCDGWRDGGRSGGAAKRQKRKKKTVGKKEGRKKHWGGSSEGSDGRSIMAGAVGKRGPPGG